MTTSRPKWRRSQSGFTLVELLLVLAISGVILVPLFAWTFLAIDQQTSTRRGLSEISSTGLIRTYFAKDVAGASLADDLAAPVTPDPDDVWTTWNRDDCSGGEGEGGDVKLVLIRGGSETLKVVYAVARMSAEERANRGAPSSAESIWRRECSPSTGTGTQAIEVYPNVTDGSTQVDCLAQSAGAPCRRLKLTTTSMDHSRQLELRASRRVDAVPEEADAAGNRRPVARIEVGDRSGSHPLTVALSADQSFDPDGGNLTYAWSFEPTAQVVSGALDGPSLTVVLADLRDYSAILTVTDEAGATNTTYRLIRPTNASPVAVATVTAEPNGSDSVAYQLSSGGSYDPEGSPLSYRWLVVVVPADSAAGTEVTSTEPNYRFVPPAGTVGLINVTLTVSDGDGGSASDNEVVELLDTTTTTIPDGAPRAAFSVVAGSDPLDQQFDGSATTDDGQVVSYDWTFGLLEGSGEGQSIAHRFGGPGTYTVTLTVTDDAGHINTVSQSVIIPGEPAVPVGLQLLGSDLRWTPVSGSSGYLVEFRYFAEVGCDTEISAVSVAPTSRPSKPVPANPCSVAAEASARVANQTGGSPQWTAWTTLATLAPGATP